MITNFEVDDFFTLENSVKHIQESDNERIEQFLETLTVFEQNSYQCVYIVDYFKKIFTHVSTNIEHICGIKADRVKDLGFNFYLEHLPYEDLEKMIRVNNSAFRLLKSMPRDEKKEYTVSYDIHINNGTYSRLITHNLTPIFLSKEGEIWLAMCTISLATENKEDIIIMKHINSDIFYQYLPERNTWEKHKEIELTEHEREVLVLSAQGYTMDDIANHICKSVDSVKSYKRNIFNKFDVKNIVEALTFAQNRRLI